jgi:hypothetical protein
MRDAGAYFAFAIEASRLTAEQLHELSESTPSGRRGLPGTDKWGNFLVKDNDICWKGLSCAKTADFSNDHHCHVFFAYFAD